jgi:hypothetical protein
VSSSEAGRNHSGSITPAASHNFIRRTTANAEKWPPRRAFSAHARATKFLARFCLLVSLTEGATLDVVICDQLSLSERGDRVFMAGASSANRDPVQELVTSATEFVS